MKNCWAIRYGFVLLCGLGLGCSAVQSVNADDSDSGSMGDSADTYVDSAVDSATENGGTTDIDTDADTEGHSDTTGKMDTTNDSGTGTESILDTASATATETDTINDTAVDTGVDTTADSASDSDVIAQPECVRDEDCSLFSTCCYCFAANSQSAAPACEIMECFVDQCSVNRLVAADVHCDNGKCMIGRSCDDSGVLCGAATFCPEGTLPEVNETETCFTDKCIPVQNCPD